MVQEIRPNYYKSASPENRSILAVLGFRPEHFETECVEAWKFLGFDYSAAAAQATKYLWRCGEKDERSAELLKARFWLERAMAQVDDNYQKLEPFNCKLRKIWPHPEAFEVAIALVDQKIKEFENGPTI